MFASVKTLSVFAALCAAAASAASHVARPSAFDVTRFIIGGDTTTIEKHPYTAQILRYHSEFNLYRLHCGGTIISKRHILTAAHCFYMWTDTRLFKVRVGSTSSVSGGATHSVSTLVIHAEYHNPPRDNDIAILLINGEIRLGTAVALGVLPVQGFQVPDNATLATVGWGATKEGGYGSENLMEVSVYAVNRATCQDRYAQLQARTGHYFGVTENMICAGVLDFGGRDACHGDSGGPLLYDGVVVGITSWGEGCADAAYMGVSTLVSNYVNWISHTMTEFNSAKSLSNALSVLLAAVLFTIAI